VGHEAIPLEPSAEPNNTTIFFLPPSRDPCGHHLCVNQVLSNGKMNSKATFSLREISQILTIVGICSSQEEHILTIDKNLNTSPEILEESRSYELQNDFPFQNEKETEKLWTTPGGEISLRPEIEEFSTSISTDPLCTSEIKHAEEKDLHNMIKESIEITVDEHQDYIETWFQEVIKPQYYSLLQHLMMPKQVGWLVLHIQVITMVTFSYMDMSMFLILLRTWLHWKSSYT
jgi:hypothetical protein